MKHRWIALGLLSVALCGAAGAASAAIYSCVDSQGRRLTSDRPIRECQTREQRLLNSDGSVRQIVPPTMTADEQAEAEARERAESAERAARQDAIRRDRNLISRFPNEAAHQKAREAALDDVRKGVKFSEGRLADLERERKPLLSEAEFYTGKKLPLKLRAQAAPAARRQRGRLGRTEVADREPEERDRADQQPLRRRTRPPQAAVGWRDAGFDGRTARREPVGQEAREQAGRQVR
jgi:hypothetical protein